MKSAMKRSRRAEGCQRKKRRPGEIFNGKIKENQESVQWKDQVNLMKSSMETPKKTWRNLKWNIWRNLQRKDQGKSGKICNGVQL